MMENVQCVDTNKKHWRFTFDSVTASCTLVVPCGVCAHFRIWF
jgi:hypothetical protein